MRHKIIEKHYHMALCVEGGDGYEEGGIYPILGDNNGIHIVRNDNGDPYDGLFVSGGYGIGDINSGDDSVNPSFVVLPYKPLSRFTQWKIRRYVQKHLREIG